MTENERARKVGERLKELRGIRPQTKLAKALGVSYSGYRNYEAGERIPRDDIKERIAKYYSLSVSDIFFPE